MPTSQLTLEMIDVLMRTVKQCYVDVDWQVAGQQRGV